jgi:hypothetical protein
MVTDEQIIAALQAAQVKHHWFNAWDDDQEAREQIAVIREMLQASVV